MTNRLFNLLLATVVALTGIAHPQTQRKCDSKKEVEGASLPQCTVVHDGQICPVLRGSNGELHPNFSQIWVNPSDENNFEVERMPANVNRYHDGCLHPNGGYEWVNADDTYNYEVRLIGGGTTPKNTAQLPPCTHLVPGVGIRVDNPNYVACNPEPTPTQESASEASAAENSACAPQEVPGKHGTLNNYRVPFNGDGHGNGISHTIIVKFTMFDDGRIEAPLTYENDSKEAFCGGVHIRLGDINNNSIADFYSDPSPCVDGRPLISLGGGVIVKDINWNLQTTPEVACKYAHLYIVPNTDHAATSPTARQNALSCSIPRNPNYACRLGTGSLEPAVFGDNGCSSGQCATGFHPVCTPARCEPENNRSLASACGCVPD